MYGHLTYADHDVSGPWGDPSEGMLWNPETRLKLTRISPTKLEHQFHGLACCEWVFFLFLGLESRMLRGSVLPWCAEPLNGSTNSLHIPKCKHVWYDWDQLQADKLALHDPLHAHREQKTHIRTISGRHNGLMVSELDSWSNSPVSSPGWGHCVVFLGKTLYSLHSTSLHPGI